MDETQVAAMVERFFSYLIEVGLIVLMFRLWRSGLARTYRYFFAYVIVELLQTGVLMLVPRSLDLYGWIYIAFAPLQAVCALLVVLELYGLVLRRYEGIGSLSRWVVSGGLVISFVLAGLSLYPDLSVGGKEFPVILYLSACQRWLASALLLYLFLITAFLAWFPVPLSRNVVVHTVVFAVFFSNQSAYLLLRNIFDFGFNAVLFSNIIYLSVSLLCLSSWLLLLTSAGERVSTVFGHRWRPEESTRLIAQLEGLNATLVRTARK